MAVSSVTPGCNVTKGDRASSCIQPGPGAMPRVDMMVPKARKTLTLLSVKR